MNKFNERSKVQIVWIECNPTGRIGRIRNKHKYFFTITRPIRTLVRIKLQMDTILRCYESLAIPEEKCNTKQQLCVDKNECAHRYSTKFWKHCCVDDKIEREFKEPAKEKMNFTSKQKQPSDNFADDESNQDKVRMCG